MLAKTTGRITVRDQGVAQKIGKNTGPSALSRQCVPWEAGVRDSRLLSLEQRAALKGDHHRHGEPAEGRLYIAGVALPDWAKTGQRPSPGVISLFARPATITIGELDPHDPDGLLRVVQHHRWGRQPDALLQQLRDLLWGTWRCHAVLVDRVEATGRMLRLRPRAAGMGDLVGEAAPRARLCPGLLEAVDAGRVRMYTDDGSTESQEFWSQAIRGRRRLGEDGTSEMFIEPSTGDDGFLVSLALAIQAASALRDGLKAVSLSAA